VGSREIVGLKVGCSDTVRDPVGLREMVGADEGFEETVGEPPAGHKRWSGTVRWRICGRCQWVRRWGCRRKCGAICRVFNYRWNTGFYNAVERDSIVIGNSVHYFLCHNKLSNCEHQQHWYDCFENPMMMTLS
jgi:hypothetical protein